MNRQSLDIVDPAAEETNISYSVSEFPEKIWHSSTSVMLEPKFGYSAHSGKKQ